MTGLDNTETTMIALLLLLALAAHSFAVPLPSGDKDNMQLAEVRYELSDSDMFSLVSWIQVAFFVLIKEKRQC